MLIVVDDTVSSDAWVEYDVVVDSDHMTHVTCGQSALVKGQTLDPAALKAILDMATAQSRPSVTTSVARSVDYRDLV